MLVRVFTRKTLTHLGAMAVILSLAYSYVATRPAKAELNMETNLLVSTRDRFRVCLQTDSGVSTAAREKLVGSMNKLHSQRTGDWEWADLGNRVPVLEQGCPGANFPPNANAGAAAIGRGRTTAPGPHRTTIFVVSDATADAMWGPKGNVDIIPYELMCFSHECASVTSGLVVRESFLDHPDFLDPWLSISVGMAAKNLPQLEPGIK